VQVDARDNRDRAKAAFGVAAFHALAGYALLTGLGYSAPPAVSQALKMFDVTEPPPPPVEPEPAKAPSPSPEGAASPVSLKAKPSPIVAPPPRLPVKPVLQAVERPTPFPPGSDSSAGVSTRPGSGTGTGGEGLGLGSGGSGSGSGSGGARRALRLRGQLANGDYPRSALRSGAQGSVTVRFTVETDGRVSGCRVTRSSGHPELDSTTCRLIERRFTYRPATDREGRPTTETVSKTYDWILPFTAAAATR
jgi:protein TonB